MVRIACLVTLTITLASPTVAGETIDFQPQPGFLKVPETITLGRCSGVAVDRKGQVYLFHRGKHPLICCDADGNYVRSWGDDLVHTAHGLRIDRDGNLWVTDIGHHLVLKFNPMGKLLLSLGTTDKPGVGTDQFDKPTDVAFGPNLEIFVSDGYGNSRVMKFTAEGKFVSTWGTPGKGPSEFNLPHTVLVDAKQRLLVGDRENSRIQVFDLDGKLLEIWPGFAPFGVAADHAGTLFVADGRANQVLRLNAAGEVVQRWGSKGTAPGEFDLPHMLVANQHGDLFVVEINGMRLQKLKRAR